MNFSNKINSILLFLFMHSVVICYGQESNYSLGQSSTVDNYESPTHQIGSKMFFVKVSTPKEWFAYSKDLSNQRYQAIKIPANPGWGKTKWMQCVVSDNHIYFFFRKETKTEFSIYFKRLDLTTWKLDSEGSVLKYSKAFPSKNNIATCVSFSDNGEHFVIGLVEYLKEGRKYKMKTVALYNCTQGGEQLSYGSYSLPEGYNLQIADGAIGGRTPPTFDPDLFWSSTISNNGISCIAIKGMFEASSNPGITCLTLNHEDEISKLLELQETVNDVRVFYQSDSLNLVFSTTGSIQWYSTTNDFEAYKIGESNAHSSNLTIAGYQIVNGELIVLSEIIEKNIIYTVNTGSNSAVNTEKIVYDIGDFHITRISTDQMREWTSTLSKRIPERGGHHFLNRGKNLLAYVDSIQNELVIIWSSNFGAFQTILNLDTGIEISSTYISGEKVEVTSLYMSYSFCHSNDLIVSENNFNPILWSRDYKKNTSLYQSLTKK